MALYNIVTESSTAQPRRMEASVEAVRWLKRRGLYRVAASGTKTYRNGAGATRHGGKLQSDRQYGVVMKGDRYP